MRTIKFRVWDNELKKFVNDGFSIERFNCCVKIEQLNERTIEQFTGEKDDGQDDLYEGDIIRFGIIGNDKVGMIVWGNCDNAWIVRDVNGNELFLGDCVNEFIEKIGDIHNNPKLLKGEQNAGTL